MARMGSSAKYGGRFRVCLSICGFFCVKMVDFCRKCGKHDPELLSWRYEVDDGFLKVLENRKAGFWISKIIVECKWRVLIMAERKPLKPGDRFGMLTVVGKDETRTLERKKQYYFCKCDCGSPIKSILKASLVDKKHPTYSCGCHTKYMQGYEDDRSIALAKLLYGKLKVRHIQKLGDCEAELLSFEQFRKMIKQPCHYCGTCESSFVTDRRDGETKLYYNGLDRIDNSIGYRLNNVVPACVRCNIAKGELNSSEFKTHIKRIHDYQMRKKETNASKSN